MPGSRDAERALSHARRAVHRAENGPGAGPVALRPIAAQALLRSGRAERPSAGSLNPPLAAVSRSFEPSSLSHAHLFLSRPVGQSKSLASKSLRGFVPLSHALGTGQVGQGQATPSWTSGTEHGLTEYGVAKRLTGRVQSRPRAEGSSLTSRSACGRRRAASLTNAARCTGDRDRHGTS